MVLEKSLKKTAISEVKIKKDSEYLGHILTFNTAILLIFAGAVYYSLSVMGIISYLIMSFAQKV